jgi:DNA invertase Pin-like site-specific DNA recombinase
MRIGYARVSTRDQNLELQLDALNKAGCERIFTDKLSGAQAERPGLKEALSHLREADTLVVWKLDRLGRSVKGLVDLVNELEAQKVHFQSVTDGVDTKTPAGRFFFHVMASLAQMERELIMERTRAGLEAARCAGRVGGRKRRMTDGKVQAARKLLASGSRHTRWRTAWACRFPRYIDGCRPLRRRKGSRLEVKHSVRTLMLMESRSGGLASCRGA